MADTKVQMLADVGPPLKVTSSLENMVLLAMALAVMVVLFLFCTTPVSRKIMIQGQLSSNTHAMPIYATQSGLIVVVAVRQGEQVKKGELLLEMATETASGITNVQLFAENDGIVTRLVAEANQSVMKNQPLAFISPTQQDWSLELYLPSAAIGSLSPGDHVDIRFDALPSRIYGHQPAIVKAISATSVSASEIQHLMVNPLEAYYRVNLELRNGCGMSKKVCDKWRLGMRVSSIVVTEKTVFIDRLLKPITAR